MIALFLAASLALVGPALAATPLAAQSVDGEIVSRDDGVAVAGVRVLLLDAGGAVADSAATDAEGRFVLRAPEAGVYRVHAEREGYASFTSPALRLEAGAVRTYRMELPLVSVSALQLMEQVLGGERRFEGGLPAACGEELRPWEAGILYGVVRDRATKEPVANALVGVEAVPRGEGVAWTATTVSSQSGTYLVCNIPQGFDVRVRVRAEGYRPREVPVDVRPGMVGWYDVFLRRPGG